jgi:hypothetical protein
MLDQLKGSVSRNVHNVPTCTIQYYDPYIYEKEGRVVLLVFNASPVPVVSKFSFLPIGWHISGVISYTGLTEPVQTFT